MQLTDLLKARVLVCKHLISNYLEEIIAEAPEYNTAGAADKIRHVWNVRAADEKLTQVIERIAARNAARNKKHAEVTQTAA